MNTIVSFDKQLEQLSLEFNSASCKQAKLHLVEVMTKNEL